MTNGIVEMYVGEEIPLRWSFASELSQFSGQSISLPTWTSHDLATLTFNVGTGVIITTNIGQDAGLTNDGAQGTFKGIAAGTAYASVSVTAANPAAVYVGVIQVNVKAIPS